MFIDYRYHLRAFCHSAKNYKDFVLSRIIEIEKYETNKKTEWLEWRSNENDSEWNEFEEINYKINPDINPNFRRLF